MNSNRQTPTAVAGNRRGFTLVEMLVAVALVLLMMSLFAQIFTTAIDSLSTQRGIAENDQRARRVMTALKADLDRMTYRPLFGAEGIQPIYVSDAAAPYPFNDVRYDPGIDQRGYFHYSENNFDDDTDDVLQFTMQAAGPQDWSENDPPPFVGKALFLGAIDELNQPDADDGQLHWNNTSSAFEFPTDSGGNPASNNRGSSNYAEVCYFLRNGNLYRRVSLIREPLDDTATQPGALQGNYSGGTGVFWNDFSYSAYYDDVAGTIRLLTDDALLNTTGTNPSLGVPKFRFGFWADDITAPGHGFPREYSDSIKTAFIGRFTHEETSNPDFLYPGFDVTDGSGTNFHMDPSIDLVYDANRGVVSDGSGAGPLDLSGGARRAEDIVLSNVYAFDVKVYDGLLNEFVDLGHLKSNGAGAEGEFHRNKLILGADGGPGEAGTDDDGINGTDDAGEIGWPGTDDFGNRFDTWHRDPNFIGGLQAPYSFIDTNGGPDGAPGVFNVDDDSNGMVDDASEEGWPGSDDIPTIRALKITIRYRDTTSNQMRDLTIIHSFSYRDSK